MKTLGVITARSGSKGIRDKNIRNLDGKPLIAYTIESARNSIYIDEVMEHLHQIFLKCLHNFLNLLIP